MAPAQAAQSPAAADRALDSAIKRLVEMPGGPPGVGVTVQRGGQRTFHTAGVASLASGARWRPNDHMRIASVAKAFSGAAALGLVDRGQLAVSDKIRTHLPWLPAAWGEVTVGQALSHTGGLPDYTSSPAFGEAFSKDLHAYVKPRALVEFVTGDPLDFPPGSKYHYSNTDNIVIGLVVAAVSGRTYSQVLRQRVFGPLQMPRTSLPTGFRLPGPRVNGYEVSPPEKPEDVTTLLSMSGAWASGGIQSTAFDLNRFVRGYVGARLFDRGTQRQQLQFVKGHSEPPGPGTNSAGLGIFKYETQCGVVYGHTGNLPGYTQFTAASLDGRRSVTVSANARVVPESKSAAVRTAFQALRRVDSLAVCAALAGP
ncbi:MAG TPA: serine hydrolase domain-containing protein [Solirubrobacterales bacterium]|nr:serine hydrolase domain-containing protein [Solirubrobacterales bacterium]